MAVTAARRAAVVAAFLCLGSCSSFSLLAEASNCTGGDGDLTMVAIYATVCVLAGAVIIALTRRPAAAWLMALAALPLTWSAWVCAGIVIAWARSGQPACESITGLPYGPSGGEASAAPATVIMALIYGGLVVLAFKRKTPRT